MITFRLRSLTRFGRVFGRARTAAPPTFAEYIATLRKAPPRSSDPHDLRGVVELDGHRAAPADRTSTAMTAAREAADIAS
jgi:hypothetical protein